MRQGLPSIPMPATSRRLVWLLLTLLPFAKPLFAGPLDFSSDETVTITAQRAWEAEEVDVIHFSGNFELHAPDWSMAGDTAVVYGDLDDPDRVVVEGKPARVSFLRTADDTGEPAEDEPVEGAAQVVEYFRATDKLVMRGNASLVRKESTLTSALIEYDVETDRYSAGGEGGINILYNADED